MSNSKGCYLSYLESRDFIRSLGFKCCIEWKKWCRLGKKPPNIPSHPHIIYKNCGWVSWMDWLNTKNIVGSLRKHKVNDDYFKTWSHNMAYILGFWFADGYIGKQEGSYVFGISQHEKDKYLLENILKKMGSNYRLFIDNRKICSFTIYSKKIHNDVTKLGGKERKSLDVKFPKVPKKYLPDFIRGLWDGDGSIWYDDNKRAYASSYVSASKEFVDRLHVILKENIPDLRGTIKKVNNEYNNAYVLGFSIKDTVLLKGFIYPESICGKLFLKRKYELFQKAEEIYYKRQKEREKLDYDDAQKIISQEGFRRWEEWGIYCKRGLKAQNIPHNPNRFYKNKGWIDWPTWFGNPRRRRCSTKSAKYMKL